MPPANNQLCTWTDIVAEVSASRMVWSGSPQSGTYCITWNQFITYVSYDGTNPGGYASNQCPPYSALLARAIVIKDPATLTATNAGVHTAIANWTAPTSGLTPTSYTVQWWQNGVLKETTTGVVGLTQTSSTGSVSYSPGDSVTVIVYSVNGSNSSPGKSFNFTF